MGLPVALLDQFKKIYLRQINKWGPTPEAWYLPNGPFSGWFAQSSLFDPVEHKRYRWKWHHTASSYVDFLRTKSDHRMLEPAKLEALLHEIAQAIVDYGQFNVDYETHLYIARRSSAAV